MLTRYKRKILIESEDEAFFMQEFFGRLEKKLRASHIHDIQKTEHSLKFKGTPFRFAYSGFYFFNGISGGEIRFVKIWEKLYAIQKIKFVEFFLIALFFSLLLLTAWGRWELMGMLAFGIWIVFFGGSYALTAFRFNWFIDNTVNDLYLEELNEKKKSLEQEKETITEEESLG